jgi:uncharacterized protein (DUF1330 family)
MPKGYIIAHVTVRNAEAYQEYVRLDSPIFAAHGGRFLVRGGQSEMVEGETLERHVVIEFADYASALACYRSPEYQKVADIRRANADTVMLVVEGVA